MTLALGFPSVAMCQAVITSREFAQWQAYDRIEPIIPNWRMLFGTVAATIVNVNLSKQHRAKQWYDILPPYERQRREQTTEQQISIVEMLNAAFGGIDKRAEKNTPTA